MYSTMGCLSIPNSRLISWVSVVTILVSVVSGDLPAQGTPGSEIREGQELMHAGDFRGATELFQGLAKMRPTDPVPSFFLSMTALWQTLHEGGTPQLYNVVTQNANDAYAKADARLRRSPDADLFFWRGASRALRLAAQLSAATLAQERRTFSLQTLVAGAAMLRESRAMQADLEESIRRSPGLSDALALRLVVGSCSAIEQETCIRRLWDLANNLQWLDVEIKYVVLSLVYGRGISQELTFRAMPLALELSLRFPTNGLFQLAAVKTGYEVGNIDSAKTRAAEITKRLSYSPKFGQVGKV